MRSCPTIIILLLLLSGCGSKAELLLPALTINPPEQTAALATSCKLIFPKGNWQFVHSIEFTLNNGRGSTMLGVTSINNNQLACALLSPEGFTLFAGHYDQNNALVVDRALPPFTSPDFAAELMADVQTIFLAPSPAHSQYGQLVDQNPICRYQEQSSKTVDILPKIKNGCWQINSYDVNMVRQRTIIGRDCLENQGQNIPTRLELQRHGAQGYTLQLHLVNADQAPSTDKTSKGH